MSQVTVRSLVYQIEGQTYEGRLAFDVSQQGSRPGLLMAPNWMGVGAGAEDIARSVAANGYVVLIADLYGQTVRPSNADEAGAAMMPLKNDRALLRKRMQAALEQLQSQGEAQVDASRLATFGFLLRGLLRPGTGPQRRTAEGGDFLPRHPGYTEPGRCAEHQGRGVGHAWRLGPAGAERAATGLRR